MICHMFAMKPCICHSDSFCFRALRISNCALKSLTDQFFVHCASETIMHLLYFFRCIAACFRPNSDAHLFPAFDCVSDSHSVQTCQKNGEYQRLWAAAARLLAPVGLLHNAARRCSTRSVVLRAAESRSKCRPRCRYAWDVDAPCALRRGAMAAQRSY